MSTSRLDPQLLQIATQLRGDLDSAGGARELQSLARNPGCRRLTAITLAHADRAPLVEKLGLPKPDISVFALRKGQAFEGTLLAEKGERLLKAYRDSGREVPEAAEVYNFEEHYGNLPGLKQGWLDATADLLRRAAAGEPVPFLAAKPRIRMIVAGISFEMEPDALVWDEAVGFYRVVEIKNYIDRRAKTEPQKTGSACRQAAAGVVGLRQVMERLELDPSLVPALCDLLFVTDRGWPTVTEMRIEGEVESLSTLLETDPEPLLEAYRVADGRSLAEPEVIEQIPPRLLPSCADHCEMWSYCRTSVLAERRPLLFGAVSQELLSDFESVEEVIGLRDGSFEPRSEDERMLGEMLAAATAAYQEAAREGIEAPEVEILEAVDEQEPVLEAADRTGISDMISG